MAEGRGSPLALSGWANLSGHLSRLPACADGGSGHWVGPDGSGANDQHILSQTRRRCCSRGRGRGRKPDLSTTQAVWVGSAGVGWGRLGRWAVLVSGNSSVAPRAEVALECSGSRTTAHASGVTKCNDCEHLVLGDSASPLTPDPCCLVPSSALVGDQEGTAPRLSVVPRAGHPITTAWPGAGAGDQLSRALWFHSKVL